MKKQRHSSSSSGSDYKWSLSSFIIGSFSLVGLLLIGMLWTEMENGNTALGPMIFDDTTKEVFKRQHQSALQQQKASLFQTNNNINHQQLSQQSVAATSQSNNSPPHDNPRRLHSRGTTTLGSKYLPMSCRTLIELVQDGYTKFNDPNPNQEILVRQTDYDPPFYISLHNESYDKMRWDIMKRGIYYEKALTSIIAQIIKDEVELQQQQQQKSQSQHQTTLPDIRVLDVGGNIGFYSLLSASLGGTGNQNIVIDSFEPHLPNAYRFCQSILLNNWKSEYYDLDDEETTGAGAGAGNGSRAGLFSMNTDKNNTITLTRTTNAVSSTTTTTTTTTSLRQLQQYHEEKSKMLSKNSYINVYRYGVGEKEGIWSFQTSVKNPGQGSIREGTVFEGSAEAREIARVITLDNFARDRNWIPPLSSVDANGEKDKINNKSYKINKPNIAILKIDVEGGEPSVIRGGKDLISKGGGIIKNIFMEISCKHKSRDKVVWELFNIFFEGGYYLEAYGEWTGPNQKNTEWNTLQETFDGIWNMCIIRRKGARMLNLWFKHKQ